MVAAVVMERRARRRVEGDIVMVVVVVSGGGNGELYGELKCGECLCGERRLERIPATRPPRAVNGGERVSEAAPTTARASSSRGCALSPRRASFGRSAFRSVPRALNSRYFRLAPLRLPVSVVRGYCWVVKGSDYKTNTRERTI